MTTALMVLTVLAVLLGIAAFVSIGRARALGVQVKYFSERFGPVVDLDTEKAVVEKALQDLRAEHARIAEESLHRRGELQDRYAVALEAFERLRREVGALEETIEDQSYGLYKPHFDFQSSEEYKNALGRARDRQKEMIREGQAAVCDASWVVGGSAREGERMAKQNMKLFLRAFNAECDAAVANVTWNNALKMEERIRKSFDALNKLGTVLQVRIADGYLALKIEELRLEYEHERKRYEEREEQRRIKEQIREEERVQRELAKAQEDAEREEGRYERALEQARTEAARSSGIERDTLTLRIAHLEEQLAEAHARKERALSRAQLTKSGYVYIISNVGSFGERLLKVGMTRRLEPFERIAELGDASVPFPFDVHAMLYSDNAPELERALHEHLTQSRVNLVNLRKEFFQVDLRDIEEFSKTRGINVEFTLLAEAREFRETQAMRKHAGEPPAAEATGFPADPFALVGELP